MSKPAQSMPSSIDIIVDILDRVACHVGPLPDDAVRSIEDEARQMWGGEAHYIAQNRERKHIECAQRRAAIVEDYRRGEHVSLLARRYRVSERRIRQILDVTKPGKVSP